MAETLLSRRLRELRGKLEVKDLVRTSGVGHAAIYKAESGEPVRWSTIEEAYGPLCKSEAQYTDLLMLWALAQSRRQVKLMGATESMRALREETQGNLTADSDLLARIFEGMTPPDRKLFLDFAAMYRQQEPVRRMIHAFVEGASKWG